MNVKNPKKHFIAYLINLAGVLVLFFLLMGLFKSNVLGARTAYLMGICTTACYTIVIDRKSVV